VKGEGKDGVVSETKGTGLCCYACGDMARKQFENRPVCQECFDELAHGKIKNQNIHFLGGGRYGPLDEDGGPWQQNAVREMEG